MKLRNALLLAAGFLALSFAVSRASSAGVLDGTTARRLVQIATGLIVVYTSNLAPKTLEPLSARCSPARAQAVKRFSAWALVVGGLGYSLTWLFAPIDVARPVSIGILASALLLVLGRCAWTLATRNRSSAET